MKKHDHAECWTYADKEDCPVMPFRSARQRRYLYARKPWIARKFARHGRRKR